MTSLVLNGKAVCCMHMGNFDEAESFLLEALNKASNDFVFLQSLKFLVYFDNLISLKGHYFYNFLHDYGQIDSLTCTGCKEC